MQLYIIAIIHK